MSASAKKVRGEERWWPAVNGRPATTLGKFETSAEAREAARWYVVRVFQLKPGEERLAADIANELGVPASFVHEIPDLEDRDDYSLHVADGLNGRVFERPRRAWTLYREPE